MYNEELQACEEVCEDSIDKRIEEPEMAVELKHLEGRIQSLQGKVKSLSEKIQPIMRE